MVFNKEIHRRKSIRLQEYSYSQQGAYFVTICTHQRQLLFGNVVNGVMKLSVAGEIVQTIWRELPSFYACVELNEYVIMPNHFHGIVQFNDSVGALLAAPDSVGALLAAPDKQSSALENQGAASAAPTLGNVLRRFKSTSAIAVNRCLNRQGQHVWQRNYYEHIIRDEKAYQNIVEYIWTNPQKWQDDAYYT